MGTWSMAVLLQHLFEIIAFCHDSAAIVEISSGSFKFAPILMKGTKVQTLGARAVAGAWLAG